MNGAPVPPQAPRSAPQSDPKDAAGPSSGPPQQPPAPAPAFAPFLDALASAAPTPGGGGAAALIGATGAALVSMVCRLTLGRKGYEAQQADVAALLDESEALRAQLATLVQQDAVAFDALMAAYRLPKDGEAAMAARAAAIQTGLRGATEAPLACARAAAALVRLSLRAALHGNRNVASDAGVAAHAGLAALRSAVLNVRINAPQLHDTAWTAAVGAELDTLLTECDGIVTQVGQRMDEVLGRPAGAAPSRPPGPAA